MESISTINGEYNPKRLLLFFINIRLVLFVVLSHTLIYYEVRKQNTPNLAYG